VSRTATRATPVPKAPARELPTQEEPETEVPVREPVRGASEAASYDVYDLFNMEDRVYADDSAAGAESFEVRPRVRVYGCCLPVCLGMLLVVIAAATALANLVIGAL
jgi:hypothetical protein